MPSHRICGNTAAASVAPRLDMSPSINETPRKVPTPSSISTNFGKLAGLPSRRSATPESRSANPPPSSVPATDRVNLNGMWYSTSALAPARSEDQAFREGLAAAYLTVSNTATTAPGNVDTNLWTNLPNLRALLIPIARHNGSELEIPHSMICNSRVNVRTRDDIENMISAVEDRELRLTLREIYDHPLTENVGARTDVVRFVCGLLTPGKLNVYADIDDLRRSTIVKVASLPEGDAFSGSKLMDLPELDQAKFIAKVIYSELEKTSRNRMAQVPEKLLSSGHTVVGGEICMQSMVPLHEKGKQIGRAMLASMNSGEYRGGPLAEFVSHLPEAFLNDEESGYRDSLALLSSLTHASEFLSSDAPEAFTDHFRFAESVRKSRSEIQKIMNALKETAVAESASDVQRQKALLKMAAVNKIFNACMQLIDGGVNVSTYLPQVSSSESPIPSEPFATMIRSVLGSLPNQAYSDSWKGKLTVDIEMPDGENAIGSTTMNEAFALVKNIVRTRLGGGYEII